MIRDIVGVPAVLKIENRQILQRDIKNYIKYFNLTSQINPKTNNLPIVIESDSRLGFEIEVENIDPLKEKLPPLWTVIGDMSLRNNGIEFLSLPIPPSQIITALVIFDSYLRKICKQTPDYSWRTSIHVHCDVQSLTLSQFQFLLKLYLCFEPIFFYIAANNRDNSNFCIPLSHSDLVPVLRQLLCPTLQGHQLLSLHTEWPKYSGLSLFRLAPHPELGLNGYGTVEYRQFPGTDNMISLVTWGNMILSLYNAAQTLNSETITSQLLQLNISSEYEQIFKTILGKVLPFRPEYLPLFVKGVTFFKQCQLYPKNSTTVFQAQYPQTKRAILFTPKRPKPKKDI